MNSLTFGLIHSCNIIQKTITGTDELGQPIVSTSSTSSACFFDITNVSGAGGAIIYGPDSSGRFVTGEPYIFLPGTASIKKGDLVTTNETEYAGSYEVTYVKILTEMFSSTIDHIEAFLKRVEKLEA